MAAAPAQPYGDQRAAVLNAAGFDAAQREIVQWPGYAPTPLLALPALARRLGVAAVLYKDEGERFGLKSFKALGGAYAVYRLLAQAIARAQRRRSRSSAADVLAGRWRDVVKDITVTCATDGNHGRSVAWGAQLFGCRCVIYIHATVSEGRARGDRAVRRRGDPRAGQLRRLGAPCRRAGQGQWLDRGQRHHLRGLPRRSRST